MRTSLIALLALAAVACSKQEQQTQQTGQPAEQPAAAMTPSVEVQMGGTAEKPVFIPTRITIKQGDLVRWVNVAAGPHNVMFPADSIPAGAQAVLTAAMQNVMGPLNGPFLTNPNETYDISFASAPKGRYVVHCLPHIALGMRMEVTVQ